MFRRVRGALLAAVVVLGVAGLGGDFAVHVATRIAVFGIAAIGLDLVVGWCGQVSLGHAAFMGLGAYTHALCLQADLPAPVGLLAAVGVGGLFGVGLGLPALRLFGPYLAVASLAFGALCEQIWVRAELTGGRMGLPVAGWGLPFGERGQLVLYALIAGLVAIFAHRVLRGPRGQALLALRDAPAAAPALGVDPVRTRVTAFAASAALTGLAGGLSVGLTDTLHPDQFSLSTSLELLVMVVVGGAASVRGALLGAAGLSILLATLGGLGALQTAALGALLLLTVLAAPRGLGRWVPAP